MRSRFLTSPAIAVALLLAAGTATASAQTSQSAGQAALNGQLAQSVAGSTQTGGSNVALPVSILSPGGNGSVNQSNNSNANSDATNNNGTTQTADQTQAGGGGAGLGAIQAAGQAALNGQTALSGAESSQQSPTNIALPIRILSPGGNGSVNQSNNSNANSEATNNNSATQTVTQDPATLLDRFAASPIQAAGQLAGNRQEAMSEAISRQFDPTNLDLPVRIFSPGENGSVDQSNNSNANSSSTNNNDATQSVMQALDEGLLRV